MKIAYIGISHLSLVYGVSAALKNHQITFIETDNRDINSYKSGNFPFFEQELLDYYENVRDNVYFSSNLSDILQVDLIFIAKDVKKVNNEDWYYEEIEIVISQIHNLLKKKIPIVIQSQSYPSFIRNLRLKWNLDIYYFVETLIIGSSIHSAMNPARLIIGKFDDTQELPDSLAKFLHDFNSVIIETTYETAELIKIAINIYLIFDITATNLLSIFGSTYTVDWDALVKAISLDPRIGAGRYTTPGFGISGGNLERDLRALVKLANHSNLPVNNLLSSIKEFSDYEKNWPFRKFVEFLSGDLISKRILIIGLSYKAGTSSIINSPTLVLIHNLKLMKMNLDIKFFDESDSNLDNVEAFKNVSKLNLNIDRNFDYIFYMYHSQSNLRILEECINKSSYVIVIGRDLKFDNKNRQNCTLIIK